MRSSLHEHELYPVNPLEVYSAYAGHWKCDNCNATSSATDYPFHCPVCSFDLCASCAQIGKQYKTRAHHHPLFFGEASGQFYQNRGGQWECKVCRKTGLALGEASYHCGTCDSFHICRSCLEPKQHPLHVHIMELVDTSLLYTESGGNWICDICDSQSRPWERLAYHCAECRNFDVCPSCYLPLVSPLHEHELYKANSHNVYGQFHGGWQCDNCSSTHNNPTLDIYPWHCQICEYDLCHICARDSYEPTDQAGPPAIQSGRNRGFETQAAQGLSFNRQPEENPWITRNRLSLSTEENVVHTFTTEKGNTVAFPEDTDHDTKCIICMEQPKNATVIHGDTGHCCCCWACAQVLKHRGDPCPICRAPIDHVIRQFNA